MNCSWQRIRLSLLAIILALLLQCSNESAYHVQGGETPNQFAFAVYMPDGHTPAHGAIAKFNSLEQKNVFAAETTNYQGMFTIRQTLTAGLYNVSIGLKDTASIFVSYNDSISVEKSGDIMVLMGKNHIWQSDTLELPGSIAGSIRLEPQDSCNMATGVVSIVGTDRVMNVDSCGSFKFTAMASGKYTLKFETSLPNYSLRYIPLILPEEKDSIFQEPIRLMYTGIPVVTGLTAMYDSLMGTVILKWDSIAYHNFRDYRVFRSPKGDFHTLKDTLAAVMSCTYIDTIFSSNPREHGYSYCDTNDYTFEYWVLRRNISGNESLVWKSDTVTTRSLKKTRGQAWYFENCAPARTILMLQPNGTPAARAHVKLFKVNSQFAIMNDSTDSKGQFVVPASLSRGFYSEYTELHLNDSVFVLFRDSIFITPDSLFLPLRATAWKYDTLELPGSISGQIGLKLNSLNTFDSISVSILGTDKTVDVNSLGEFKITGLSKGNYRMKLKTMQSDCVPLYKVFSLPRQKDTVFSDTFYFDCTPYWKITIPENYVQADPVDIGTIRNCFDSDTGTIVRSAFINPFSITITFPDPMRVGRVRVLLGQIGKNSWAETDEWVLTGADSSSDLLNKKGSYTEIVPVRGGVAGAWDEVTLQHIVSKKIFAFEITRTLGDNFVHVPEIELWSDQMQR